jgi:hypothetical protein
MPADFTRAGYSALLEAFLARGYAAVGYSDAEPSLRHLIVRHDLDMSIDAALPIAEIEAGLGVASSYFVLLRTDMYNPWAEPSRRALRRIAALGHEIGLHLDSSLYPDNSDALEQAASAECEALEKIVEAAVKTVSFHRPAPGLLGREAPIAGRQHAYQPRFFSDMGYCSDSRGAWHHGQPLDHQAVTEGRALQLLTHPIWWNREAPLDPVETLDRFRVERDKVLEAALADNCEPYRAARSNIDSSNQTKR